MPSVFHSIASGVQTVAEGENPVETFKRYYEDLIFESSDYLREIVKSTKHLLMCEDD